MFILVGMFYLDRMPGIGHDQKSDRRRDGDLCSDIADVFLGSALVSVFEGKFGVAGVVYYFSTIEHMGEFSRGLFDTRPIVFYLSMTLFTLFLTFHVFQHRRWKS